MWVRTLKYSNNECYNMSMSETAMRDDIDEVLSLMREYMKQVDKRFSEIEKNTTI
jgi:hypothetical protein